MNRIPGYAAPARWSGALVAIWLLSPVSSHPQILDDWSGGSGLIASPSLPQARLDAMGGMLEAVADENNEIHLLDFAGNLTGHLSDKPTAHLDIFSGTRAWKDLTTAALGDQSFTGVPTSFAANLLKGNLALGGSTAYTTASSDRLVTRELRRRFRLPIENGPLEVTRDVTISAEMRSPRFTAHVAHKLSDRLAYGLEGSYRIEREDRHSPIAYRIDHRASAPGIKGSIAVEVLGGGAGPLSTLVVGANGEAGKTTIDGTSEDDLHQDSFFWERPMVHASVHAIAGLGETVKGAVDFRYTSFEGQEDASINWSPLFALNPTSETLKFRRLTLVEGFRSREFRTRWQFRPATGPYRIAGGLRAGQEEYWQYEGVNVNAFVTPKSEQVTSWQAVGGGSYYLEDGRGLIAGELAYGFSDLDNRISRPTRRTPTAGLELGVGGEYFPVLPIGIRAGYRRMVLDGDRDRDDPILDTTTNRFAGGVGYRTPDGLWQLDLSVQHDMITFDDAAPQGDQSRTSLTVQSRWLL